MVPHLYSKAGMMSLAVMAVSAGLTQSLVDFHRIKTLVKLGELNSVKVRVIWQIHSIGSAQHPRAELSRLKV